jgi:hypothetical protein
MKMTTRARAMKRFTFKCHVRIGGKLKQKGGLCGKAGLLHVANPVFKSRRWRLEVITNVSRSFSLVVVIVFILIAVVLTKAVLKNKSRGLLNYPYEKVQVLFSPAERSFLGVLERTLDGRYRLMGKVRLADVVKVKGGMNRSNWQMAFNRIRNKHVDIVACDPATFGIRFVIELDDSSHGQAERQNRDDFVDKTLYAVGIPVVHIAVRKAYSVQDIHSALSQAGIPTNT